MGYDNYSIIKYMKEYDVRKKLESNSKLCMLSDEKLKAAIEKWCIIPLKNGDRDEKFESVAWWVVWKWKTAKKGKKVWMFLL